MVVVMWYTGCVCCNGCVAQNWLWLCGIVSLVVVFAVMVMWYTGWLIPLFIVHQSCNLWNLTVELCSWNPYCLGL